MCFVKEVSCTSLTVIASFHFPWLGLRHIYKANQAFNTRKEEFFSKNFLGADEKDAKHESKEKEKNLCKSRQADKKVDENMMQM